MDFSKLFFLLPSKGQFLQNFAHNEQLKAQAELVWRQLDGLLPVLFIITLVSGIGFASYYYTGFNERPGRHYKIKFWAMWAAIAFCFSLLATIPIEYIGIKTNVRTGLASLYWLCAINNALYCLIIYILTSWAWCQFGSTNAYKFLKI